jgi:hypothetical protein
MNRIKIQLAIVALAGLVAACGNGNQPTAAVQGQCGYGQTWNGSMCVQAGHMNYGGQYGQGCQGGQVPTQFGCVQQAPQGYCTNTPGYNPSIQYGWYNNQCVPATQSYPNSGYYNGGQNYCGTQNGMPMVMTQYNCLPQGSCPMGYGQLAPGQCIPALNTGYNTGMNGGAYWGWNWGWR